MLQHPFHSSFSFTTELWHVLASLAESELQSSPRGTPVSASCFHTRGNCGYPALLGSQLSFPRKRSWKSNQGIPSVCSVCLGFPALLLSCLRLCSQSQEHLLLAGSLRALSSSHTLLELLPALPVWQREAQSITGIKTKPRMSLLLRISENVFGAFWCDGTSQLIYVISLSFFGQSKLKFLLHLCPTLQFCCILIILLSNFSASATVILSFLLLSSFMNEIPLTCFFLTEEMLCKNHFLCSFTINQSLIQKCGKHCGMLVHYLVESFWMKSFIYLHYKLRKWWGTTHGTVV